VVSPNYNSPGLDRPKIKYILSVIDKPDRVPKVSPERASEFVFKFIPLLDLPSSNLLSILDEARTFIQTGLRNNDGAVLVHCAKGISRSASVVIAIVMEEMSLDYGTARNYVFSCRSKIRPNEGFEKQLQLWAQMGYSLLDDAGNDKPEYQSWKSRDGRT
jgi:protein-tyrosine phosphatase